MKNKKVSVIIPFFNSEKTLMRALESVRKQKYRPIEIILINDGSVDNSNKIVHNFELDKKKDLNIKIIYNKTNKGIGYSRNRGIQKASGEYVAFLDSDDEWIDGGKLCEQVNFLDENNNDYGFVGTGWENSNKYDSSPEGILFRSDDDFRKIALYQYPCHTSTWLLRANIVKQSQGFWLQKVEDYEYILKIGCITKMHCLEKITTRYNNSKKGYHQRHFYISFFYRIYICWLYRKKYPFFVKFLIKRILRAIVNLINLWKNQRSI